MIEIPITWDRVRTPFRMKFRIDSNCRYYENPLLWGDSYWSMAESQRAKQTSLFPPVDVKSVLDVGCGAGIVTCELRRRFAWVVASDRSNQPLEQAKEIGIPVIQADVCALPFHDRVFDLVVATELIEHLTESERIQALKEMSRVARQFILVTVPYRESLEYGQVKCGQCGCVFNACRHTSTFDEPIMKTLLNPGWAVKKMSRFGPRKKRIPRWCVVGAQIFGGYMSAEKGRVLCPQCGNVDVYVSKRNWITRLLTGIPSRMLPLRRVDNWLGALYEKRQT